jgi:hypothetical protein
MDASLIFSNTLAVIHSTCGTSFRHIATIT